jgi:hypothetical protein
MKYKAGDQIAPVSAINVKGEPVVIPDPAFLFTHVQFKRWAGDPIGKPHVLSYKRSAKRIRDSDVKEVIFFYSDPMDIAKLFPKFPAEMVGDLSEFYYHMFGVEKSSKWLSNFNAIKALFTGLQQGFYNFKWTKNGVTGLPADFLIATNGKIVACRYGLHAADQWEVNEMLYLVQTFEKLPGAAPDGSLTTTQIIAASITSP